MGMDPLIAGGGTRTSFHHNLWAHHQARNPRPGNPVPPDRDPKDSDADGMPDVWESSQGSNPATDDSARDVDGDGYTNIEAYLNELAERGPGLAGGERAPVAVGRPWRDPAAVVFMNTDIRAAS